LSYVVILAAHQLSTNLHVHNTSASGVLEFQALLHTYIRAPANDVIVSGLQNTTYYDKTETTEEGRATPKLETRETVDVKVFTDSVYENASRHYEVTWPGGGIAVRSNELKDLVIWNPQRENGMKLADLDEGGWYISHRRCHANHVLIFS
jgi:glucose-6-phosphate 1-epimerase